MSEINISKIFNIAADFNHILHPLELTEEEKKGVEPSLWDRIGGVVLLILMSPLIFPPCLFLYWANKKVEKIETLEKNPDRIQEIKKIQKNIGKAKNQSVKTPEMPKTITDISPVHPDTKKEIPALTGFIRVDETKTSIYVGNPKTWGSIVPDYNAGLVKEKPDYTDFFHHLTFSDGSPLSVPDPGDTLVSCAFETFGLGKTKDELRVIQSLREKEFLLPKTLFKNYQTLNLIYDKIHMQVEKSTSKTKIKFLLAIEEFQKITQENGSPFSLNNPYEKLISCQIFNTSDEFEKAKIPSRIILPEALLAGKKNGDLIRFKYEEHLIEVQALQLARKDLIFNLRDIAHYTLNEISSYRPSSFEDAVTTISYSISGLPYVGVSEWSYKHVESLPHYTISAEAIDESKAIYRLIKATPKEVDLIQIFYNSEKNFLQTEQTTFIENTTFTLRMVFPGISSDEIEIFVHENSLVFLGKDNWPKSEKMRKAHFYFNGWSFTQEEMEQALANSRLIFEDGILDLELPLVPYFSQYFEKQKQMNREII